VGKSKVMGRKWGVLMVTLGMAVGLVSQAAAASPPLIPRELLFGNPERAQGRISPDGLRMSYLAPKDGVLNVWVKTIGKNDDKVVTDDKLRGIRIHSWALDNKHILYLQDQGGNENWHIYSVDLATGDQRDLTPYEGAQARIVGTDPKYPAAPVIKTRSFIDKPLLNYKYLALIK